MKKLNLGCGEFHREGYVNVDCYAVSAPDVRHDLEQIPFPFADNEFDEILLEHVLEHLSDPFAVMRELHRIAAPEAIVKISVPHFSRGFTHPEHKRGFDVSFSLYFNPEFIGGYQGVDLQLHKTTMIWFAQPELKKRILSPTKFRLATVFGHLINGLAALSPDICSRLWCFWVGGFEEIRFVFKVKKAG